MENEDQTPSEDDVKNQTLKDETASDDSTKKESEQIDYEAKFKESQKEAIRLAKENEALKNPQKPKSDLPDDEKLFRERVEKYEQEKLEQAKKEDKELKSDLDKLHAIHGDFDNKKLLNIVDRYGVYDDEGNVQWERAMELYERLGGQAEYKPKKPAATRTSDKNPEVDQIKDIGKKSMNEIVSESLKKFGIGG